MPTITLTKGYTALVDDEDADLAAHSYWASVNGPKHVYAKRHIKGSQPARSTYLHREIAERIFGPLPPERIVDHANGDTLDCRRANLRAVSHAANTWNQHGAGRDSKSGIRGVRYRPEKQSPWQAYICEGRKMRGLGSFGTMEGARAARLAAEREREMSLAA